MVLFSKLANFAGPIGLGIAGHGRPAHTHEHPSASVEGAGKAFEADMPDPTHAFKHVNSKRGDLGVRECKGKNWKGPCKWTKADG